MPKSHIREDSHLKKSMKLDSKPRNTYHFSDGADVQRYFQNQNQDSLSDGELSTLCTEGSVADCLPLPALTALRNQLTIKFGEEPVQPQDERLALARSWMETAPGTQSIFNIWESTTEVRGCISCLCLIRADTF
jgi:nucleolar pre-ribosomal-associated protein 1